MRYRVLIVLLLCLCCGCAVQCDPAGDLIERIAAASASKTPQTVTVAAGEYLFGKRSLLMGGADGLAVVAEGKAFIRAWLCGGGSVGGGSVATSLGVCGDLSV
jgi:hypothetical protein